MVIVDSIQTATIDELDGAAGSVGQVRELTLRLMDLAKGDGIAVVLVGHVTKDGGIAGPKTLEHLVDAVINLEGERYAPLRLLRATKNRFGSKEEVGVFEMAELGLAELADPARAFLGDHGVPPPGSVVAPTSRAAGRSSSKSRRWSVASGNGSPRRNASGVDPPFEAADRGPRPPGRAVPRKPRCLREPRGGLAVEEPALDLPLAIALASSLRDRPIGPSPW